MKANLRASVIRPDSGLGIQTPPKSGNRVSSHQRTIKLDLIHFQFEHQESSIVATVSRRKSGSAIVQFNGIDGKRRTLSLGHCSEKLLNKSAEIVDDLLEAARFGRSPSLAALDWIEGLSDSVFERFVAAGLVHPRGKEKPHQLEAFINAFLKSRTDIKPRTQINIEQARNKLVAYFGAEQTLSSITLADAQRYARWLEDPNGAGLSSNTARRLLGRAKQIFAVAVDDELLRKNPFKQKSIRCAVSGNRDRMYFVDTRTSRTVLDACPSTDWKLIFALARWGGLRTPSETLALRWADVNWERSRIRISVPKLEHIEGLGERWIPLFPELRTLLTQAFEEAEPGTEFVISKSRDSGVNLRTGLLRILRNAGVAPWPKLYQNLRSTRQTELAEIFPGHVVSGWIGNSETVARKHYLQITDTHFETASSALQNALQHGPELGETRPNFESQRSEKTRKNAGFVGKLVPPQGLEP